LIEKATNDSLWVRHTVILASLKNLQNPPLAEKMFFEALEKLNNNSYTYINKYEKIASVYDCLGILERRRNQYDKAFSYYLKALKVKEEQKDSINMGRSFHNIGMLYNAKRDYDKALDYMRKALPLRKLGDSVSYAVTLNDYGYFLYKKKRLDSALFYFNTAKQYFGTNMRIADANNNIARLHTNQKQYKKAREIHLQSLEVYKKHDRQERIANILKDLAVDSRRLNDFTAAENYLKQSETIANRYGNKKLISILYRERYRIAKAKGDFELALKQYRTYKKYNDSVFTNLQSEKIKGLELNYFFEKEQLADSLNYEAKKKQLTTLANSQSTQKQLYGVLLIISIVTLISLYFLYKYRLNNNLQKIEKQQLEAALLNQKIETSKYRIEHLLTDNKMRIDFKEELLQKIKLLGEGRTKDELVSEYQSILVEIQNQVQTEKRLQVIENSTKDLEHSFMLKLA
jgi:tetratricopeptide (TPR) repeat protein